MGDITWDSDPGEIIWMAASNLLGVEVKV